MATRFSPAQVLKDLLAGPGAPPLPTAHQVAVAAEKHPRQFAVVLHKLFSAMSSEVFRFPGRDITSRWVEFSRAWRGIVDSEEAEYYFASLDAYHLAAKAGLRQLAWSTAEAARSTSQKLTESVPCKRTVEGLAWRVLLGQIQSIYSREDAARTFREVRDHCRAPLVPAFYRDTGALTYYSETEVQTLRRELPSLAEMCSWEAGPRPASGQAILISVNPSFFRIYAAMILHNAQQLPFLASVILLCCSANDAKALLEDAEVFLSGLMELNRQAPPKNARLMAVPTPEWVANEKTFYACSRFLALPDLLQEYESIYAMDADLFMLRESRPFIDRSALA